MKRIACGTICLILTILFIGCNANSNMVNSNIDAVTLTSGMYYAEGDYEVGLTPYVSLSFDDNAFRIGTGSLFSFAAYGSFETSGSTLIATTQISTFVFEVKDPKTLVLIDNGENEYFQPAENTKYIFCGDMQ